MNKEILLDGQKLFFLNKEIYMDSLMNKYSESTTSDSKILEFYKLYLKRKDEKGGLSEHE